MAVGHDRGHIQDSTPIDRAEHDHDGWEHLAEAVVRSVMRKQVMRLDELRRGIESLDPETYERLGYFARWVPAVEVILTEKGFLTRAEIDAKAAQLASRAKE